MDFNFIEDFDYFLKTEKNNSQVTINKKIQRLKKVIKIARKQKLIDFNPFDEHKPKQAKTKIVFLTQDELDKLKNRNFKSEILNKVRDCYIFCCYTGLGYSEMFSLKKSDLKKDDEGIIWIYKERQKTERAFSIPLIFDEPLAILEKYKSESEYLLPRITNQYFNRILKEIAEVLEINKKLTHHTAEKQAVAPFHFNDSHINTMAKDYYEDKFFSREEEGSINLWRVYNLFTQANKSSYIDTFLDRSLNAFEFIQGIKDTKASNDSKYHWFLS